MKTGSSLFFAVFCCGAIATGCSGSSDPGAGTSADGTGLEGTYAASGDGPIDAIRFDAGGYGLIPSGCTEASCTEAGTYTVDASGTSLSLTDAKTNTTRTMSLQITGTEPASSTAATRSVQLDDLVTGGTGSPSIVGSTAPLVNVASNALVNGQQVALLINGVNVNPACLTGIPTGYGDPNGTKAAAYWAMCPQGVRTPLA